MYDRETILHNFSKSPRLLFITVRGPGRWQQIGKINDFLRKISSHYFIVREKNKKTDGFHYHALVSQTKDIKPNWFRKGVHIHVTTVAKSDRAPKIPECSDEDHFIKYGDNNPSGDEKIIIDTLRKIVQADRVQHRANVKLTHLNRIVDYMFKESSPQHSAYLDYILKSDKKVRKSPGSVLIAGASAPPGAAGATRVRAEMSPGVDSAKKSHFIPRNSRNDSAKSAQSIRANN